MRLSIVLPVLLSLAVAVLGSGCARERAPAADDIDGLSRFLFAEWEDPDGVADGMSNLAVWLESEGRGELAQSDGFVLNDLTAEEIGALTFPDRVPLEQMVGVVVAWESPWSLDDHAALLPMQDQTWNAPRKYELYDRSVIEGSADAFLAQGAHQVPELIRTDNDVLQSRVGVEIPYTLRKDYRWVVTEDGQRAVVGRTWAPEIGCSGSDGESGNCLELSFSVDLFYDSPEGDTLRMTASWNYLSLIIQLSEDFQISQLANGMIGVMEDTDVFLAERSGGGDGT